MRRKAIVSRPYPFTSVRSRPANAFSRTPDTLDLMNVLANSYSTLSRHDDGLPLYQRLQEARARALALAVNALALAEANFGRDHADTLAAVHRSCSEHHAQGDDERAEPLYIRALEGRERVQGRDHADTLASASALAGLYELHGRYDEAEPLYIRTLEARDRTLGRSHPDALSTVVSLSGVYEVQGRFAEAAALYQRLLDPAQSYHRNGDYPAANSLLAATLQAGRHASALEFLDDGRRARRDEPLAAALALNRLAWPGSNRSALAPARRAFDFRRDRGRFLHHEPATGGPAGPRTRSRLERLRAVAGGRSLGRAVSARAEPVFTYTSTWPALPDAADPSATPLSRMSREEHSLYQSERLDREFNERRAEDPSDIAHPRSIRGFAGGDRRDDHQGGCQDGRPEGRRRNQRRGRTAGRGA